MPDEIPHVINDDEYLYRGIINAFWDYENDRHSSATFKDSNGISVDRDYFREEGACISSLLNTKDFYAICKVKAAEVRELDAIIKYEPTDFNKFHSEIHDSEERIQLRGSKPTKIRNKSVIVYKK